MHWEIRQYAVDDRAAVVELSIKAWTPVFASMAAVLDPAVFDHFYPDWPVNQRQAVETVCAAPANSVWVAVAATQVVGFVATTLHAASSMGEIVMLAVDPAAQQQGLGGALTEFALQQLRAAGMRVAMVETGDDPGHGPARRTYERQGFQKMAIARYFQAL